MSSYHSTAFGGCLGLAHFSLYLCKNHCHLRPLALLFGRCHSPQHHSFLRVFMFESSADKNFLVNNPRSGMESNFQVLLLYFCEKPWYEIILS